jgi:hypothetical protein
MRKLIALRAGRHSAALSLVLAFALFGLVLVSAQEATSGSMGAQTAQVAAPVPDTFDWLAEAPSLTEEQQAQVEYWTERTGRTGPPLDPAEQDAEITAPVGGSETTLGGEPSTSQEPQQVPGDPLLLYVNDTFGPNKIPAGNKSNVMETSVAEAGRMAFATGNWWAARSKKGGWVWEYVSPWSGFPEFCCDQRVIYDESRNKFFWVRMGIPDANGENVFKLSVNTAWDLTSWCTYTVPPTAINGSWTHQWWDYPGDVQIGADYLYIVWNMFDWNGTPDTDDDYFVRTVVLRWPIDELSKCESFGFNYFTTDWFTLVPVQGAWHTMYLASNWPPDPPQNNRLRIYKWEEDSTTIYWWDKSIHTWTATGRYDAQCGGSSGNWAYRLDQRVLTGARYSINSDGIQDPRIPGRKILAWWWTVGEGGDFAHPYIDAAAFYEEDMTQVGGWLGRPYVWSSEFCFAYPSCTPNKRQDLGMVFHYAEGPAWNPDVAYTLADDYTWAPPGWTFYTVRDSNARPSDRVWGDYNTVREYEPSQKIWVAGSHYIPTAVNCEDCSEPLFFVFGRRRDYWSYYRWKSK